MAPRPTWKGSISFGLVTIPVNLYPAEKANDLHFNMLDKSDKSRVKYLRINESTGKEVPWENIVKGYKLDSGEYVVLEDDDFKKAAVEATQTVDIVGFVDRKSIDYIFLDKPYYLVPSKAGIKGYLLLKKALEELDKVGVAKVVISTREHLAAVIPEEYGLLLSLLRFQNEIRPQSEYEFPKADSLKQVTAKELAMAKQLVNSMAVKWKPEEYHDEYRDALVKWIEKKAKLGETAQPEGAPAPRETKVVDLMDMLQKSLASAKGKAAGRTKETTEAPKRAKKKAA